MEGVVDEAHPPLSGEEYTTSLHMAIKQVDRQEREIFRLKNSVTYRLGEHLTDAIRRPWKLLILPLTFPCYSFLLGLEKLGLKSHKSGLLTGGSSVNESKNCVLLFPTNGVGFGHFTRMYAVGKAIRKHSPETEVIFFTPMPTLHVPYVDNFPTYHMAGKYKFNDMSSSEWNGLVEEQLQMVLDSHNPKLFMFDGAYPYRGMLNAIRRKTKMSKIWMRRGMIKKGSKIPVDSIEFFDKVIHPGDALPPKEQGLEHSVEIQHVPPILLVQPDEMLPREEACGRLGIPSSATVWYVQLGAGQINDIESEIRMTIEALLESDAECFIVIGESLLGQRVSFSNKRVRILRDYPNGIYFKAFDYSIQAGGYNSFHEMRANQIPTIFYPNMSTGMDDQLARCRVSEVEGWGLVVDKRTSKSIRSSIAAVKSIQYSKLNRDTDYSVTIEWVSSLL